MTTVVLTLMIGPPGLFAMSRDHLLPPLLSKVHPLFRRRT